MQENETVEETTVNEEEAETEEEAQTEVNTEAEGTETEANEETTESETEDDEEIFVTVGDEEAPPQLEEQNEAPEWVKEVRKQNRELHKEIKELRKQNGVVEDNKPTTLSKKPTLEDFDYDSQEYETALDKWHEKKVEVDKQQNVLKEEELKQADVWKKTYDDYSEARKVTKIRNYDQAEAVVEQTLSIEQQNILLEVGKKNPRNSVLLVAAIGSNPERAKELALITNPFEFSHALGEMGTKLKTHKKKPPNVDKKVTGDETVGVGDSNKELNRLREEAEKSGDFSKYSAYKRKK